MNWTRTSSDFWFYLSEVGRKLCGEKSCHNIINRKNQRWETRKFQSKKLIYFLFSLISDINFFLFLTFFQSYRDRDAGKIVLYTTSMGVVRSTYAKCQTVKKILKTLMLKFEERDVFMSQVNQLDIRERMASDTVEVPQLFVDGQYIGVSRIRDDKQTMRVHWATMMKWVLTWSRSHVARITKPDDLIE